MMCVEQSMEWELEVEHQVFRENLPRITLFTINPTWYGLGSKTNRRGEKTNLLSCDTNFQLV
jgi:hypothetical protein